MNRQEARKPLRMTLPSVPQTVQEVEEQLETETRRMGIPEDIRDSIAIAVTEMVNNAVCHGNNNDPGKMVYFEMIRTKQELCFEIRDEGEGFQPDEVPDPLDPENILKESGRGIFIVKSLMDSVSYQFTENGTVVTMTKKMPVGPSAVR